MNAERHSPSDLRSQLKTKGWTLSNLAFRWGISLGYLCGLVADRCRPQHWEDAFCGLPAISRIEARQLELARKEAGNPKKKRPRRAPRQIVIVHEKGDLFISTNLVGVGEGYRYALLTPETITEEYDGTVTLYGVDFEDEIAVEYRDLLELFVETGAKAP